MLELKELFVASDSYVGLFNQFINAMILFTFFELVINWVHRKG